MNIFFLTKGDKSVGSSRQRVWLVAEKLKLAYGYTYIILYPEHSDFKNRKKISQLMRQSDILFVHKSLFAWRTILRIVHAKIFLRKKLIYDLDDAEWYHSFFKTVILTKMADQVFCGSHVILTWVEKYNKNSILVSTVVDHELYARYQVEQRVRDIYTIGWVGMGKGHFLDDHFAMIRPALDALFQSTPFRFVVVGSQNYQPLKDYFKDAQFETIFIDTLNWADSKSVPRIIKKYEFDIGLMPTSDTPFNRAKCAFKAIEYMACGVPVVASSVGENSIVVEDGTMGFLAESTIEWTKAMSHLLKNTELRKEMGERGLHRVKEIYSYEALVPVIHTVISNL